MKTLRFFLLLLSLTVALTVGLQNCKKAEPDPVTTGTTSPGSNTTTPGSGSGTAAEATQAPRLTTDLADSIKYNSARLQGTITNTGGYVSHYGFIFSATETSPQYTTVIGTNTSVQEVATVIGTFPVPYAYQATASLKPSTTYYFRAFARNKIGIGYGEVKSFKTIAEPVVTLDPPVLSTPTVSGLTATSAVLNGTFTKLSNLPILSYGFVLSDTDPNPRAGSTATKTVSTSAPSGALPIAFRLTVRDLRVNTRYYVRSFATVKLNDDFPTPKTQVIETTVDTFTTPAEVASGSWKELGPFPSSFSRYYDFFYEGDFYTISSFDLSTYSFSTQKQTFNPALKFPGTGSVGDLMVMGKKVYALMNYKSGESTKPFNEVWEYDLVAKKWARKADFPGLARIDGKMIALNGKLYFGTGNEYTKARPGFATTLKDWWEYDPATDKWTQKADMPVTAYDLKGFDAGGRAVVGLGLSFTSPSIARTSWYEYNPQTNAWKRLNTITGDYAEFSSAVWPESFNSKNYVLFLNKARTKYAMWGYNPTSDSWSQLAELPLALPQSGTGTFYPYTINGKPVVMEQNQNKWFEFNP